MKIGLTLIITSNIANLVNSDNSSCNFIHWRLYQNSNINRLSGSPLSVIFERGPNNGRQFHISESITHRIPRDQLNGERGWYEVQKQISPYIFTFPWHNIRPMIEHRGSPGSPPVPVLQPPPPPPSTHWWLLHSPVSTTQPTFNVKTKSEYILTEPFQSVNIKGTHSSTLLSIHCLSQGSIILSSLSGKYWF